MNTFHKQSITSSFPSNSLVYSTSTQNNHLSPAKSFINQDLRQGSLINPSIESSAFTFNNLQVGNQMLHSNLQKSVSSNLNMNSSLKFNPFTQSINPFTQTTQLSPRFSTIKYPTQQNKIIENNPMHQLITPSHQILSNQQNYQFNNNRSSLKNFQQNINKNTPFSQFKNSPSVYKYHENFSTQNLHNQNKTLLPKTQFSHTYDFKYQKPQTQGENYSRIQRQDYRKIQGQEYIRNQGQDYRQNQPFLPASYDFNKFSQNNSSKFNDKKQKSSQVHFVPPIYHTSVSNPSVQYFENNQPLNSTLQSKLLNRELTQLKSDESLKSAVINDDGVQRFPVKFGSNFMKEKDFNGFCGCGNQRIIFDAAEKTPFC